ncbi:glycosyltransferase family 2 protein [Candidatus Falkowbacteria bacterium]|nr:glycosyltransferase family 2 protein [Candidatus Falkowbacteria bacterium]
MEIYNENKKIAVVLINYHDYAERFLRACRDSLRAQSYDQDSFEVYIIDNDSSEGTFNYLKNEYPEAKILKRSDGNYSAANNLGFQEGIKNGADYLVALNMDTEVEPDFLLELAKALENNSEAGLVQAKILLYPNTEAEKLNPKINSVGNIIHYLGFGFTNGYGQPNFEIKDYPEIKGYASGCAFIIRKEVLEKVGGLNEEFYMYHDDIELSLKVSLLGYKIVLAPKAIVFHKYEFSRSVKMIYYIERNRYLTLFIFASKKYLALIFIPLLFMNIAMFFFALLSCRFKELLKIYGYFLRAENIDNIIKNRQEVKAFSKLKFSDIAQNFQAKIDFQEISNPILKYVINPLMSVYWFLIKRFI